MGSTSTFILTLFQKEKLKKITAIARCRPTGALQNPFLPEFTEYIVYDNLDSHEEEAHNPIVEKPSHR